MGGIQRSIGLLLDLNFLSCLTLDDRCDLGSCQDEDYQKGIQSHHREVLYSIDVGLPHQ